MSGGLKIHLYCLCWNDARMLPYFFRHYDPIVDEYHVYDNGSTDASLAILSAHGRVKVEHFDVPGNSFVEEQRRLSDSVWQASRGRADWVIVTDIDEHIHRPDLLGYLARCRAEGITAVRSIGYEMVADAFPAAGARLTDVVTRGCRSFGHDRLCVFNPDAISATHYSPGRHQAWPEGHVVWPNSSEVLLLHYKQLGVKYVSARSAELASAIKPGDLERGWGTHYRWSARAIAENWARMKSLAVTVPGLGERAGVPPAEYRGDEKIVERSGLLDADWYLATYPDVADVRAEALAHFCQYGWKEGRMPNFYFDPRWYQATVPGVAPDVNPLVHYFLQGEREGARPSPHFDPAWYRGQHGLRPDESPLRHYLLRRRSGLVSPLPDFDLAGFLRRHPDTVVAGRDPYEESIESRRPPAPAHAGEEYPAFDTVARTLGIDPATGAVPASLAWHAVREALQLFLNRYPVDEAWYRQTYPDVDLAIRSGKLSSARAHFIEHGYFEGRHFRARPGRVEVAPADAAKLAAGVGSSGDDRG